jgi:hypothetical protein
MLVGLFGRPYLDLAPHLDLGGLDDVHEEICLALTQVPVDYTGGSHRSMGIVPPSLQNQPWVDYGEVIRALSDAQFEVFRSLSDDPNAIDVARRQAIEWGEERDVPLSRRQMLWLKYRFGVYFPWKVFVELIPNRYWADKSNAAGKSWTRLAKTYFPKTVAFVEKLPFTAIGRCNVMGLEANDDGTVHRDGLPSEEPATFVTLCPAANKKLFLWDEEARAKTPIEGRAYWFNDCDYHGVEPAPHFRYSIRIDGVFEGAFLDTLRRAAST